MEEDPGTETSTTTAQTILKQEMVKQITSMMPTTIRTTLATIAMEDALSIGDFML